MSYTAVGQYIINAYSGGPTFAALYLTGFATFAPTPSNLPAPVPLGRYGAWSVSSSGVKNASHQIPVRIGPRFGFVTVSGIFRPGPVGPELPAYGN